MGENRTIPRGLRWLFALLILLGCTLVLNHPGHLAIRGNLPSGTGPQGVSQEQKAGWRWIDRSDIPGWVTFLSSERMAGRGTATPACGVAARYVAERLDALGVAPVSVCGDGGRPDIDDYFQMVPVRECTADRSRLEIETVRGGKTRRRRLRLDYEYRFAPRESFDLRLPVMPAGNGICEPDLGKDDYAGADVAGKAVLIFEGIPGGWLAGLDPGTRRIMREKYAGPVCGRCAKLEIASAHGAGAVIYVPKRWHGPRDEDRRVSAPAGVNPKHPPIFKRRLHLPEISDHPPSKSLPVVIVSPVAAGLLMSQMAGTRGEGSLATLSPDSGNGCRLQHDLMLVIHSRVEIREHACRNVFGMVVGWDPRLRDEFIVVGAHLDHLGRLGKQVYNGANDNASGVAAVLAVAAAVAGNPARPRRSLLFAFWTGEEVGLLGSRYFTDHPLVPLEKIRVYLNVDSVGFSGVHSLGNPRLRDSHEKRGMEAVLLNAVVGAEAVALIPVMDRCNRHTGFELVMKNGEPTGWQADYVSFGRRGVPWISLATSRSPHHHRLSDTVETVSFATIRRVAQWTYLVVSTLADG